jgi:hypothetical protein
MGDARWGSKPTPSFVQMPRHDAFSDTAQWADERGDYDFARIERSSLRRVAKTIEGASFIAWRVAAPSTRMEIGYGFFGQFDISTERPCRPFKKLPSRTFRMKRRRLFGPLIDPCQP